MNYFVIFSNDTTPWYLRGLKKGFRRLALTPYGLFRILSRHKSCGGRR